MDIQHGIVAVCGFEKHFLKCQVVPEYVPCRLIWLVSSNEYIHIVTNVYNRDTGCTLSPHAAHWKLGHLKWHTVCPAHGAAHGAKWLMMVPQATHASLHLHSRPTPTSGPTSAAAYVQCCSTCTPTQTCNWLPCGCLQGLLWLLRCELLSQTKPECAVCIVPSPGRSGNARTGASCA